MKTLLLRYPASLKNYYSLTKPGVLFGNVFSALAGFLFAAVHLGDWSPALFIAFLIGMTLVIASACVLNNYLDRDIDSKMERTKDRATVTGAIGMWGAIIYAGVLGVVGLAILFVYTNTLTALLALFGFVVYVVFYGMWSKRKSMYGTFVGAISGAMPILAGYTAVAGFIDVGAILVFLAIFFWQIPEFFSIAVYRRNEYKYAGVPIVSVVKGIAVTKKWILIFTILFVIASLLLTAFHYTGYLYFIVMALLGIYWSWLALSGFDIEKKEANDVWAKRMFHFSLTVLIVYSVAIILGPLLP